MSYWVELIRKAEQSTSTWTGGTTTQLAIYPKTADYKMRDFKWRLSSAEVELQESTFTSLPGIYRHIMIIEGEMKLIHEGHHTVSLKPFMKDSFSGGWSTRSIGCARDFNLMLNQGCKGELEAIAVNKAIYIDTAAVIPDKACKNVTQGLYCAAGSAVLLVNETEEYALYEGDLALVNYTTEEGHTGIRLESTADRETVVIRSGISY